MLSSLRRCPQFLEDLSVTLNTPRSAFSVCTYRQGSVIVEVKKEQFLARCCLITLARSTLQIRQLLSCSALLQLHPVSEEVVTHLFVFFPLTVLLFCFFPAAPVESVTDPTGRVFLPGTSFEFWIIIVIVLCVLVVIALIILIVCCVKKRKEKSSNYYSPAASTPVSYVPMQSVVVVNAAETQRRSARNVNVVCIQRYRRQGFNFLVLMLGKTVWSMLETEFWICSLEWPQHAHPRIGAQWKASGSGSHLTSEVDGFQENSWE